MVLIDLVYQGLATKTQSSKISFVSKDNQLVAVPITVSSIGSYTVEVEIYVNNILMDTWTNPSVEVGLYQ